jgi:hypothetical protein
VRSAHASLSLWVVSLWVIHGDTTLCERESVSVSVSVRRVCACLTRAVGGRVASLWVLFVGDL